MFFRSQKEDPPAGQEVEEEPEAMEQETVYKEKESSDTMEEESEDTSDDEPDAEGTGIRVVIREKNFVTVGFNGEVDEEVEAEASTGVIKVQNTGSQNRITGIDLVLENVDSVDSESEIATDTTIGVLAPGRDNDWKVEYSYSKENAPISVVQEYYDPENGLSPNFLGGAEKEFEAKISISNTSDQAIYNVKGTKTLNDLASLKDSSIEAGEISSSGNTVSFEIEEIEAGNSVEVLLKLSASLPGDVPAYEAGELKVTYEHRDMLGSGLGYVSVDGVSDFKRRIRRVQRETEPTFYDCTIMLENKSEFVYDLNQFSVFAGNLESQQMLLDWNGDNASDEEKEIIPSEKIEFEFVYESLEGTPSFGDQIEFSVQSESLIATETEISMPGRELRFMALTISKALLDENGEETNDFEIPSYVETEVPSRVIVTGVGTYPLEGLEIRDEIPEGFSVQNVDEVKVSRNGTELSPDMYDVMVGTTKSYTPEQGDEADDSTSTESLIVTFSHLEETEEGGFDEEETITIDYVAVAEKLVPRDEPVIVQAHAEGFVYEDESARVYAHSEVESMHLVVVHLRDDVDVSKFISATDLDGKDAYQIELEGENHGSSTIVMEIQDLIPDGFELVENSIETSPDEDVEYSSPSSADGGLVHGWTFNDIKPSDSVMIKFTLVETVDDANPRALQSVYKG